MTVTRRDGESLVLMSQREAEGRSLLLPLAAQLITVALDDNGTLAERMTKPFPWMLALSPTDRTTCAQNLVDAARASWEETWSAIAAGLDQHDLDWLDDDHTVERP